MKKRSKTKKSTKKLAPVNVGRGGKNSPKFFISYNFSDIEDSKRAFEIISSIFSEAGKNAVAEAKAAGLSRIFVHNNQLIQVTTDGKETVLKTNPSRAKSYYISSKTSNKFHAVRK